MRSLMRYLFIMLIVFLSGCTSFFKAYQHSAESQGTAASHFRWARRYLERGQYKLALEKLNEALTENTRYARNKEFMACMQRANRGRANDLYHDALNSADAGMLTDAQRHLRHAASLDPNNLHVQNALQSITQPEAGDAGKAYEEGITHYEKKKWSEACAYFVQAISITESHIPARVKKSECEKVLADAERKFRSADVLAKNGYLTAAQQSIDAISPDSPYYSKADTLIRQIKNNRAEAEKLYQRGIDYAGMGNWLEAQKQFQSVLDLWRDHDEAGYKMTEACMKLADNWENQGLPGHAWLICLKAREAVHFDKQLYKRTRVLSNKVAEATSRRIGLLVTDAGQDGRKAGKVEAVILSAQKGNWPDSLSMATSEEMKVSSIVPAYMILCKVVELKDETRKSVEPKSRRIKVGTKRILNPEYTAARKEYEQARFGTLGGIAADLNLRNTPKYIEEDVYQTEHYSTTEYHHSASICLSVRLTEPVSGKLVDSFVLSDSNSRNSPEEQDIDLLSPLISSSCKDMLQKVRLSVYTDLFQNNVNLAKQFSETGRFDVSVENWAKAALLLPDANSITVRELSRGISPYKEGLTDYLQRFALEIPISTPVSSQALSVSSGKGDFGVLGVRFQQLDPELAESLELRQTEGVVFLSVLENSAASKAGLERGDVILEFNGERVEKQAEFRNQVRACDPGTMVSLVILRHGERKVLTVELSRWPRLEDFIPQENKLMTVFKLDFGTTQDKPAMLTDDTHSQLALGTLTLSAASEGGAAALWYIELDDIANLLVDCVGRHLGGSDPIGFALTGDSVGLRVGIDNNGNCYCQSQLSGADWTYVIDWDSCEFYRADTANRLTLLRLRDELMLFVNGYLAGSGRLKPFPVLKIYLLAGRAEMGAEFDNLEVKVFE